MFLDLCIHTHEAIMYWLCVCTQSMGASRQVLLPPLVFRTSMIRYDSDFMLPNPHVSAWCLLRTNQNLRTPSVHTWLASRVHVHTGRTRRRKPDPCPPFARRRLLSNRNSRLFHILRICLDLRIYYYSAHGPLASLVLCVPPAGDTHIEVARPWMQLE